MNTSNSCCFLVSMARASQPAAPIVGANKNGTWSNVLLLVLREVKQNQASPARCDDPVSDREKAAVERQHRHRLAGLARRVVRRSHQQTIRLGETRHHRTVLATERSHPPDRKSVVEGKSVSVRVDSGGGR